VRSAAGSIPSEASNAGTAPKLLPAALRGAPESAAPATTIAPAAPGGDTEHGFVNNALLQVVGVFAASFIGPLVLVLLLFLILRRQRRRDGALFRIEVVGNPAPATAFWVAATPTVTPPTGPASVSTAATPPAETEQAEAVPPAETGERFDIGPSYEDELRLREERKRQQEEAVLRQLFEENVRLREQMDQEAAVNV